MARTRILEFESTCPATQSVSRKCAARQSFAQPTLVMAGIDDPLVPAINGRILASLIPDARLLTIDDGHLFLVTSAGESAAMISEFLR
jgi:pimeloyl-ACP methyl ester carboxylesterase